MSGLALLTLLTFIAGTSLFGLVAMLVSGKHSRIDDRLHDLVDPLRSQRMAPTGSRMGIATTLDQGKWFPRLRKRLIHAGFYRGNACATFLGVRALFIALPVVLVVLAAAFGFISFLQAVLYGLVGAAAGWLLPNFWLDYRKEQRQAIFRRSLPDALDMVAVCLKGGLSLQAAFQRATPELVRARPLLGAEFVMNERDVQNGQSVGETLRQFAERADLPEVHGLASVVIHAERAGGSTANAIRAHAETLREQREERSERSFTGRMLLLTAACLLSAILVVSGPSIFQALARVVHVR